jgi:L-lactate utilization protein LutC
MSEIKMLDIENLINSSVSRLDSVSKELKEQKSMLDAILDNDLEYQEVALDAKKQSKLKIIAKQKVMALPNSVSITEKIKDAQSQVKELKTALSDYLSQYVIASGSNQIEMSDGVLRQIIHTAKLIKLN